MNLRTKRHGRVRWLLAALAAAACGQSNPSSTPFVDLGNGVGGELQVYIANYEDGTTASLYALKLASGDTMNLVLDDAPDIEPGAYVAVQGTRDAEGKLRVASMREIPAPVESRRGELALPTDSTAPLPPLKVAVLILDSTYTPAAAHKRLLEDVDSAKNFYREMTYGAWNIDGEAFGPFSVDTTNCGSRYNQIATDARAAAKSAGVPIESFTQVAYYVPRSANCGLGGLGSVGKIPSRTANGPTYGKPARDSWYAGSLGCVVINQELGHNYGMQHGHFCAKGPYNGGCQGYSEYGNPFSPMGTGCGHLTAVEAESSTPSRLATSSTSATAPTRSAHSKSAAPDPRCSAGRTRKGRAAPNTCTSSIGARSATTTRRASWKGSTFTTALNSKNPSIVGWQTPANGASDFLVSAAASSKAGFVAGQSWAAAGGATFRVVSLGETATIEVTNSGKTGGATCLDSTPAPEGPPTCCATGVCDGSPPDGGTFDAGRPDAAGGAGGGIVDAGRDRDAGGTGVVDAASDGHGGSGGSGGAAGDGGSGGAAGGSGGSAGIGGATPGTGGTTGTAGSAGGPTSTGSAGRSPRPGGAGDAVGGCSCRLHDAPTSGAGRAWLWAMALAACGLRRRSRRDASHEDQS